MTKSCYVRSNSGNRVPRSNTVGNRIARWSFFTVLAIGLPVFSQSVNPFAPAVPATTSVPAPVNQLELPAGGKSLGGAAEGKIAPASVKASISAPASAASVPTAPTSSVPNSNATSNKAATSPFGAPPPSGAPSAPANATATPGPASLTLAAMPNPGITLKFDNADIYDVLQVVLGDALKLDYVIDPSVQGRVTLKSSSAVSMADIYSVLETALATSGVSIVKLDKIYKVTKDVNAARERLPATGVGPASPVLQIIPVKFVQASQLANTLRNFLGAQAVITNDPTSRYLIVADRQSNVDKVIEMVATLDVDFLRQVQVRLIPLINSDAADVAKDLDSLFKTSGMFNWAGTDGTKVYFLPISRMNALLVATANDKLMEAAEKWIKTLDSEPKNGFGSFVHVYPVANGNAAHLADILRQLFGGSATPSTPNRTTTGAAPASPTQAPGAAAVAVQQPTTTITRGNVPASGNVSGSSAGLSGSVLVIADEATNTLIIKASAADFQQIKKLLERVDTVARQVLIQVMVAEIELNDTLQYGVEWWLNDTLKYKGRSWNASAGLEGFVVPPTAAATGVVTGSGGGLNYSVFNNAGQIIGLLNLLGQDTNVNVLSAPHVMASDGKLARIEVGDEVPVVTQTSSTPSTLGGPSISNSVTYRPTGIILEVTPVISASGRVSLVVSQEVSSVQKDGGLAGGLSYPKFSKRKVSTEIVVEDGNPIMFAGLIRDSGDTLATGIPLLKDIPGIGALFGTTKKTKGKNELLMTITPFIINGRSDGDRVTTQFQNALKELKPLLLKGVRPFDADPAASKQPAAGAAN